MRNCHALVRVQGPLEIKPKSNKVPHPKKWNKRDSELSLYLEILKVLISPELLYRMLEDRRSDCLEDSRDLEDASLSKLSSRTVLSCRGREPDAASDWPRAFILASDWSSASQLLSRTVLL